METNINTDKETDKDSDNTNLIITENKEKAIKEIRIALIGNVDSGKSSLVGVLSNYVLDNGRGSARESVFNFKHEKENGRTSSIAEEIMFFSDSKQLVPSKEKKSAKYNKLVSQSDKIITLLDLCGHEKYLKTTLFGLTCLKPNYTMIVIGANMGIQRMTKEHLGIALALRIPIFVVVTKIDIAPEEIFEQTLDYLIKILKSPGAQKIPVVAHKGDDLTSYTESISSGNLCPIFCISNVSGNGIEELKAFMALIKTTSILYENEMNIPQIDKKPSSTMMNRIKNTTEFLIESHMMINNVDLVINGLCTMGNIAIGQYFNIGPDSKGDFRPVIVKSIHYKQTLVNSISEGNIGCLFIKTKDKDKDIVIRKGMLLVDKDFIPICALEFEAEVVILHHSTIIKPGYKSVIHCGHIRQAATVVSLNCDLLRSGDRGVAKFKFISNPEYLHLGSTIIFREGRTRGLGKVTTVFD